MKKASGKTGREVPTLDDLLRYEASKLANPARFAEGARRGDREILAKFAGLAAVCVETATALSEVWDALVDMLAQIQHGAEPNDAFGWNKQRGGNPGARGSLQKLQSQWIIGQHMAGLVANGSTIENAAAQVSADRHVSARTAIRCLDKWNGKGSDSA